MAKEKEVLSPAELLEQAQRLIKSQAGGDATAAVAQLLEEKREERQARRDAEQKLAEAVPEGAVVLSKADAARFEQYKAFGTVEAVKQALEEGKAAKEKAEGLERQADRHRVADLLGWDAEKLGHLSEGLIFEVKTEQVTEEGETRHVQRVYVKDQGGEGDAATLAGEHPRLKPFAASLQKEKATPQPVPPATPFPKQTPTGQPPKNKPTVEDRQRVMQKSGKYAL